ncbi:MAG: site-2 protease family protein [Rhodothermales bacterium]|nr:site-2 protease family protein [Rhodothermales bacterium]
MKANYRLGAVGGFEIFLHWTFSTMMVGLFGYYLITHGSVFVAIQALTFIAAVFGSVILHELGHAFMARRFGIPTLDITMYPIGGVARLERMPTEPRQELLIAVAGPAVNIAIGIGLLMLGTMSGWTLSNGFLAQNSGLIENVMKANFFLAVFNLIPAFPMDGGRVLRALLAMKMRYKSATTVASFVGQGIAGLFFLFGLAQLNIVLMFIGMFVFVGARQEALVVSQTHT